MNYMQLNRWLQKYEELGRQSDRLEDKMERREAEGNMEKVKRLEHLNNEVITEMRGMRTALNIFGYDVKYSNDHYVIIVY